MKKFLLGIAESALIMLSVTLLARYAFGAPDWASLCTGLIISQILYKLQESNK